VREKLQQDVIKLILVLIISKQAF